MGGRGAWSTKGANAQSALSKVIKANKSTIADNKIKKYVLDKSKKHAQDFYDVGYTIDDAELLKKDLSSLFENGERVDIRYNEETRVVKFAVIGELGKTKKKTFKTGWQIDDGEEAARFITGFRYSGKKR